MLHKIEPKVQRMEYRVAFAAQTAAVPQSEIGGGQASGERSMEEMAPLIERIQELDRNAAERERAFVEQLERETAAACERGRAEEAIHRTALLQKNTQSLEQAVTGFAAARDAYLSQVEQEVVRLALSIAARILHREAQMDPLLLSGAVRVALGQLSDTTEVRLRVPAAELSLWSEMIQLMPNLPLRPQLVAEGGMGIGECALETHLGSVDLGVKAQLAEIERGFFDLLERREPPHHHSLKPHEA